MIKNIRLTMKSASSIAKRLGIEKDGRAEEHLRDLVEKYSDPYVPMETGFLKNNTTHPSKHEIRYPDLYSHYMYKGKKAIGASHPAGVKRQISNEDLNYSGAPKRGAEWDKRMMNDRKNDIIKSMQSFIKKGGK